MLFLVLILVLLPTAALAQGVLENPAPGSAQSGIGIVSGWKCTAGVITVTFDDGAPFQAAYGTARADTQTACGDINNGYGLLFNWSILGDGPHTVKVFDAGVQFGSAIVTVATFGTEFLEGQAGTGTLTFAGRQVTVSWSEAGQNFVVTNVVGAPVEGEGIAELQALLGTWQFRFTILTTFTNTYAFQTVDTTSLSYPVVSGSDAFSQPIVVVRVRDADPATTLTRKFLLVDPGTIICNTFFFDQTSPTTLVGEYLQLNAACTAPSVGSGTLYPMTATRTGAALSEQTDSIEQEHTALAEASQMKGLSVESEEVKEMIEIVRQVLQ